MIKFVAILVVTLIYLTVTNIKTYRIFALDKRRAMAKETHHRIPETTLLWYASIGGWGAAKYAQHMLKHKTFKQPFGDELNNIGRIQGMVVGTLALTFFVLALVPAIATVKTTTGKTGITYEQPAAATVPPAGAPVAISLRPPAVRPATW